jgi:DNA-binding MarR family transcriptional regulator
MKQVTLPPPKTASKPKASPGSTLFGLLEAARALETRLEAAMDEVGLSMAKFGVLKTLAAASEPVTLTELASCQRCVRSNITQLIDRLESDGLVKRIDDPADRRSIRAAMTPLGRDRFVAGERALKVLIQDVSNVVSADDREALSRLFAALK